MSLNIPFETPLAVITETIVVMSVMFGIVVVTDSFSWFVISCCISPLALLRSEESINLGARWFFAVREYAEHSVAPVRIAYAVVLPIIGFAIRLVATARFVPRGLASFPSNWRDAVWTRSMFEELSVVPGTGTVVEQFNRLNLPLDLASALVCVPLLLIWIVGSGLDNFNVVDKAPFEAAFLAFSGLMAFAFLVGVSIYSVTIVAIIGNLHAILYRLTLKATGLLWLPLMFALNESRFSSSSQELIANDKNSNLWDLIRGFSFLTIAAMTFKLVILPTIRSRSIASFEPFVSAYLTPGEIYPWQIVSTINAVLALAWYYIFLDNAEKNMKAGKWTDRGVRRWFNAFYVARAALSTYTIPALLLISLNVAQLIEFDFVFVTEPLPFDRPSSVLQDP